MRPKGPHPARVYWTRRALVLVPVLVVAAVVWAIGPGGRGGSGAASAQPGDTTPTSPTRPASSGGTHTTTPPTSPHTTSPLQGGSTTYQPPEQSSPPPPVPTGPCKPLNVPLEIRVSRAVEGRGAAVRLRMATKDGTACTLGLAPSSMELRITSGPATIWDSTTCPDGLPAKNVVVTPRPAVVYTLHWDGHVDANACRTGPDVAQPGGYWVAAALVGGDPQRAYFPVVSARSSTG